MVETTASHRLQFGWWIWEGQNEGDETITGHLSKPGTELKRWQWRPEEGADVRNI